MYGLTVQEEVNSLVAVLLKRFKLQEKRLESTKRLTVIVLWLFAPQRRISYIKYF